MRPPRLLLLFCFIALPIFLTFVSLLSSHADRSESINTGYSSRSSRLRALFSFHTPSSLFPPSAIISLTDDNSTFFLARPGAFGPQLPKLGLKGQLWVGNGFGDDTSRKRGTIWRAEGELGCSDVPGWKDDENKHLDEQLTRSKAQIQKSDVPKAAPDAFDTPKKYKKRADLDETSASESENTNGAESTIPDVDDGTDDYLHHPLPESNPAGVGKPGQPAEHETMHDKSKKPTHADIQSLQESAEIAGRVVLLSRGGCGFLEKVKWVQRRGGIALIVGDDEPGRSLITMYAHGDTSNITIPSLFTTHTTAHLLSSLIPSEGNEDQTSDTTKSSHDSGASAKGGSQSRSKDKVKPDGPVFTPKKGSPLPTNEVRPSTVSGARTDQDNIKSGEAHRSWVRRLLAILGFGSSSGYPWQLAEDSRRPPSSGSISWILQQDWDEEKSVKQTVKKHLDGAPKTSAAKGRATSTSIEPAQQSNGDGFVIGVHDWRDPDLVNSQSGGAAKYDTEKGKPANNANSDTPTSISTSGSGPLVTDTFKGGSITPGSGEYDHTASEHGVSSLGRSKSAGDRVETYRTPATDTRKKGWFSFFGSSQDGEQKHNKVTGQLGKIDASPAAGKIHAPSAVEDKDISEEEHEGLWVTMMPATASTNPFFDTLLVLVVSPLVTLTVVYALLLLRSRIRRRRWRAPKSVVERLPVRTYHTMSTSSSTSSSQLATPTASSPASPLLRSTPQRYTARPRPRSQTTSGVIPVASSASSFSSPSSSPPKEKEKTDMRSKKRYTGRQVECVVCLEEYVDGQSRVMSLPCGHEFHAECITPWLVNRRRTCPICKGDVVRSMAHDGQVRDQREEGEARSDDIQARAAETVNDSPSAAIPIPTRLLDEDDSDLEQGMDVGELLHGASQLRSPPRASWRNLISSSMRAMSGETLRQTPNDRDR